ncbi:hypothetical protein PInf_021518 [Phytophthora infestans]|nr:hypothetical protein PInf_021518 [Phytophthora infestans]
MPPPSVPSTARQLCYREPHNARLRSVAVTAAAQVFQGFHDAFFQAYDAMLGGDSVAADAWQLAFLQDKLLPAVQDDDSEKEDNAERKATLVKLVTG